MDITKQLDSRCSDIASSFAEQFDSSSGEISRVHSSSSNNGMQHHTIKSANSPPCEEENTQNIQKTDSNSALREGDIDTHHGSSNSSPTSKSALPQQVSLGLNPNIPLSKSIRDEKDIKMEETSLSPQNASPLGMGGHSNRDIDDNGTPTLPKTSNLSPLSCDKSATTFFRSACNELQERSKSAGLMSTNVTSNLDGGSTNINMSPKSISDGVGSISNIPNLPRNVHPFNGNSKYNCSAQGESHGNMNSAGGGGGGGEYMQQQNHVFVFSTQLANKSAEAVVGGQFPTIIAYHCMQPSTKLFLEDFLKNPAKTTKLQRQYSLNIMSLMQSGLPRPGSQSFWLNECNNSNKFPQRPGLRNVGGNKNSPGWDPAAGLDNQVCTSSNSLDLLNNTDCFDNVQSAVCAIKEEDKSNIPSLQGVKVPDENLTPQQRQHREEQLAKLKKMNKFLFPENEGQDFHAALGNSSVPPEAVTNSSTGPGEMLHNSGGNCSDAHNISGNTGKQSASGQRSTNQDNATNLGDGDDTDMMSADMMTTSGESSNMQPHKHGCISKMNTPNMNMIKSRGRSDDQINAGLDNNQDMSSSFNMNSCPASESEAGRGPSNMNLSHEEWSKFQNNAFADSFKSRHPNAIQTSGMQANQNVSQQNSALSRSLSMSVASYGIQSRPNAGPSPTNRNNNGPPPPYHQTQRSASVPIATQSPTNANSNNSNADMPLPSPQGSRGPFGASSTPPNVDMSNSSSMITNSTHSSTTSFAGGGNHKNIYSREGSNVANSTQVYSHSTSVLNSMAANQPTSLAHISHRDMDLDSGHKSKRSSPHKSKSPMMNEMQDNTSMEPKYTNFGLNYATCGMPPINAQNMRQNMQQMPSQFCRRIDNIPLNPNCNRVNQNKPVSNFDPIASLAQMSQQLTGSTMGLSTIGAGNNVTSGLMDGELMTGPSGRTGDPILDHCNQMSNNNIGMVGLAGALGRVTGFAPDVNLCGEPGSMDQRMLNGKMCLPPNFNHNALTGVGLRDTSVGCNDMLSNRTTVNRRMPSNFDNFSMNPNIHVKVSAPNTIQYMPARSQNLNMRVPPSIEFFQRYANPQVMGNMGVGNHPGHVPGDIANPNMMNIFGNCGQMPAGVGRGGGGFEQNDLGIEGNLIPNDAYMNVP